MAKQVKAFNPFYVLLTIVGVAFALTAVGYGVMSVKMLDPLQVQTDSDLAFVDFFDRHGVSLMLAELGLLAVTTFLAIGTDGFWTRRAERKAARRESNPSTESSQAKESA